MHNSRRLIDLSVPMHACCAELELELARNKIQFLRVCTYRSAEEQDLLYALGRTKPGLIVTHAKGGQSPHNHVRPSPDENGSMLHTMLPASDAADYYPIRHGKLCDDKTDDEKALWEKMGRIGESCGLEWGGRWSPNKIDRPHFQMPKKLWPV